MNKKIFGLLVLPLLFSCGGSRVHIDIPYSENPIVRDINNQEFKALLDNKETFISYITFSNLADCACSNSESLLKEYLTSHNYDAYRIVFDAESEHFEDTYNELVQITGEEAPEMAIPDLIKKDGKTIIPSYPRMLLVTDGYIVINTNSSFISILDRYVTLSDE